MSRHGDSGVKCFLWRAERKLEWVRGICVWDSCGGIMNGTAKT